MVLNICKPADPGEGIVAKWKVAKEADGRRNRSFTHHFGLPCLEKVESGSAWMPTSSCGCKYWEDLASSLSY